jgi:LexA DNA binding domain-containing protein
MTLPLTKRQEQLWRYIKSCERSPSYDEMAHALGYSCRGQRVYDIVTALHRKGYVRKVQGGSRNIVAIDPNQNVLRDIPTAELSAELARRLAG